MAGSTNKLWIAKSRQDIYGESTALLVVNDNSLAPPFHSQEKRSIISVIISN